MPARKRWTVARAAPGGRLRLLITPDPGRWKPMLGGLALFAGGVGALAALRPSPLVEAVLLVLACAAWFVGACAMIGYVRWFFASEMARARQDQAEAERKKG
jgi:hypothetical protein